MFCKKYLVTCKKMTNNYAAFSTLARSMDLDKAEDMFRKVSMSINLHCVMLCYDVIRNYVKNFTIRTRTIWGK